MAGISIIRYKQHNAPATGIKEKEYLVGSPFIYSSYVGTNAEVVDDNEGIQIIDDDFVVFSEILWSNVVNKPV